MYYIYAYDLTDTEKSIVYSPHMVNEGCIVTSAKVTNEVGKAGEVSFTIPPSHPLYRKFKKIITMIVVYQDDKPIWFGRVFSIKSDFNLNKTIVCEGALTFLEDICLMPFHYFDKVLVTDTNDNGETTAEYKNVAKNVTKWDHLNHIMNLYNKRCHVRRKINITSTVIGDIHTYTEISGSDSYNTILSEIQNKIIEDYNYSLLTTYSTDENGEIVTTVTLGTMPFGTCTQKIEFGKNLIDFEEFVSAADIYSSIVPVGAGNMSIFTDNGDDIDSPIPIADRCYYVDVPSHASCGVIDRVIDFNNVDNREDLNIAAQNVIKLGGGSGATEFTINAVDLHLLDVNVQAIHIGENVRVVSAPHGIDSDFVCHKEELNLLDPSSSRYSFKSPQKTSPETITAHLFDTISGVSRKLNQKINLKQTYGLIKIGESSVALSLKMRPKGG